MQKEKGLNEIRKRIEAAAKFTNIAVIYDFDIDGCTAAALLWRFFKINGATAQFYATTRGFQNVTMDRIRKQDPDKIVTVDHLPNEELTSFLKSYNTTVLDHHQHEKHLEQVDYVTAHDYGIGGSMGYVVYKALQQDLKDVDWIVKLSLFWDKVLEDTEFYYDGIYQKEIETYMPFNLVSSLTQVKGAEKIFEVINSSSSLEEAREKVMQLEDYRRAKDTFDAELKEIKFTKKSFPDIKLDVFWIKTKFKHMRVYVDYITYQKTGTSVFIINEETQFKFSFRTSLDINFVQIIRELNKQFPTFSGGGHAKACGAALKGEQVEELLNSFTELYKKAISGSTTK